MAAAASKYTAGCPWCRKDSGIIPGASVASNVAVYSRPHVLEDGTLAFGMADRLTHANLAENPHAVYAFDEGRYRGVRLYLEKIREETTGPLLEEIRARAEEVVGPGTGSAVRFVAYFRVVQHLPLVGAERSG